MRFSKKLIALCLSVTMLLAMSFSSALAVSFSDVPDDSTYKTAVDSLVSLGLIVGYDDGTFRPEATITRAEFAAVMTRAMGQEQVALSGINSRDIFTDMVVDGGQDHWATGYVRVAYNLGIILGMGDGTFDPDAPVTYEQAVKMVVCALGYEPLCIDAGGWPDGYLAVANDLGVTRNAVMQPTAQEAPRGMVAKLLYNSLNINLMERAANGGYITTTKTILSSKLQVVELRNAMVVNVDGVASLNPGTSSVRTGQMVLETSGDESAVYRYDGVISSVEARGLLGYYVNCYYKYDESYDERILVSLDTTSYKNTSVTVTSDMVYEYSSNGVLTYYEQENSNRTNSISIASDAKLIHNGKAYNYQSSSNPSDMQDLSYWLSPNSPNFFDGEVTLLDSGADGTADVVFLYDYETFVVKEPVEITNPVEELNYVITDAYVRGKTIRVDPTDPNIDVSIINAADNSEMQIEALRRNDVVSIAESMEEGVITCYVSRDTIEGRIDELSSDGYYVINNREYELTPEFKAIVQDGSVISLDLDSSGTFYLDRYGRIAGADVDAVQTSGNFGYITAVAEDLSNECLSVRMILSDGQTVGRFQTNTGGTGISINGETYNEPASMYEALRSIAGLYRSNQLEEASNTSVSQLVRYRLNSRGEISSITTAAVSNGVLETGTTENVTDLKLYDQVMDVTYKGSGNFDGILADSNTKILAVPDSRSQTEEYQWMNLSSFKSGRTYKIEGYNVDNNNIADIILVYGDVAAVGISEESTLGIIAEDVSTITSSTLGPNNDPVYRIKVYQNGGTVPVEYETEDTSSVYAELKAGDAIRFGFNGYGQVNEVKVSARANALTPQVEEEVLVNGEYTFKTITGTVVSITDSFMRVAPAFVDTSVDPPTLNQDVVETMAIASDTRFYMVSGGQVMPLDNANYIVPFNTNARNASKVFTYQYEGDLKTVVIYAN